MNYHLLDVLMFFFLPSLLQTAPVSHCLPIVWAFIFPYSTQFVLFSVVLLFCWETFFFRSFIAPVDKNVVAAPLCLRFGFWAFSFLSCCDNECSMRMWSTLGQLDRDVARPAYHSAAVRACICQNEGLSTQGWISLKPPKCFVR